MASHFTIITGTNGSVSARGLNGQKSASGVEDALGAFATMLEDKPVEAASAAATAKTSSDKVETEFERLARLALDVATGEKSDDTSDGGDAVAAALDLQPVPADPVDPAPMVDLVEALSALKASLDAGKPLDPDLLTRIDNALTDLAEALGLDLATLPVPDDFAALLDDAGSGDSSLSDALAQLLAPLVQPLAAETPDAGNIQDQLKPLGDKLAALLAALQDGAANEDRLAAIGMKPGEKPAEEIEAALSRFAAMLKSDPDVPEEPVLAAPALKTSEPAIVGKASEAPAQPAPLADAINLGEKKGDGDDRPAPRENQAQQRDTRPAAPAPGPADNATPQTATAASQDNGVLRIDPATTPRVIQAGYQTSQQQLNLPQIAFELARQVQDGNTRFQIRLDPPELGKIDVRLDIDKSGQVHARLTVEKSETLDLMQRDQRALERALQQAGLDGGKTNLEFSLKQNPFAGQGRDDGDGGTLFAGEEANLVEAEEAPSIVNLYRGSLQASGVNIIA